MSVHHFVPASTALADQLQAASIDADVAAILDVSDWAMVARKAKVIPPSIKTCMAAIELLRNRENAHV